jgi:hypothetical protein
LDGPDDTVVASAAAQVSLKCLDNGLFRRFRIFFEQGISLQDHSGSAVSALKRALFEEGLLERMELTIFFESFNGNDAFSCREAQWELAGKDRLAVDEDGAGPAKSFSAAGFRAGVFEVCAKDPEEHAVRIRGQTHILAVESKSDVFFHIESPVKDDYKPLIKDKEAQFSTVRPVATPEELRL